MGIDPVVGIASARDIEEFSHSRSLGARAWPLYERFVNSLNLDGDVAKYGVYTKTTSQQFLRYLREQRIDKLVHLFDTFEGLPDVLADAGQGWYGQCRLLRPGAACLSGQRGRFAGWTA